MKFDKKILIIDTETTGTKPGVSSIIQFGARFIDTDGNLEKEGFNAYIKPYTIEWTEKSEKIHNITQKFLNENGVKLDTFCSSFIEWVGDPKNFYFGQWGCGFDTAMLQYAYKFSGYTYPFSYRSYDISSIVRFYCLLYNKKPSGLKKTARMLNINIDNFKNHDAFEDASMTALVFKKVIENMECLIKLSDKNKKESF